MSESPREERSLERQAVETLTDQALRQMMGRLSPEAFRALRAVSRMRNQSPEDALRDEIRQYIEDKVPVPDVEYLIHSMRQRFYQLGYTIGSLRRWLRDRSS